MKRKEATNETQIVVENSQKYSNEFIENLNKKRVELITSIVYRVLSEQIGL